MSDAQSLFPHALYGKQLSRIQGIPFTSREIDVISCLLSARRTDRIALLLSIEKRTVETHFRNIMVKLNCNTRDGVIDFMETSNKLPILRQYYALLQNKILFENSLKEIAQLNREKGAVCILTSGKGKDSFVGQISHDLALSGITVSAGAHGKEGDYEIIVLPDILDDEGISSLLKRIKQKAKKILLLLRERTNKIIPNALQNLTTIDFAEENYYFSFFRMLKNLLPDLKCDRIIDEFKVNYEKIPTGPKVLYISGAQNDPEMPKSCHMKRYFLPIVLGIGLIIGVGYVAFHYMQNRNADVTFQSDFALPGDAVFLQRPKLISQIEGAPNTQGQIQTVALVGPGGAGKTTLARQYAHQKKINSIWEIDAETLDSLRESFEKLANALAKTEEQKKDLREINAIGDLLEREEGLIKFVKQGLKPIAGWILIYDNVEAFADIQKYFPHDPETWGQGKVILTTRNSNIADNTYINHTIPIAELTPHEKLTLFTRIMTHGSQTSEIGSRSVETEKFLEAIPPFPLDVSIAAYYLKATNIPYAIYLDNMAHYNKDFTSLQHTLLKEAGDYTKTRYGIITQSLQRIMDTHKGFAELLLLMSLIDSQNIPRELLNRCKDRAIVDDFLFNLKKYSLLMNDRANASLSMHRSTQAISLSYLVNTLGLEKTTDLTTPAAEAFERYLNEVLAAEDIIPMKILRPHCYALLRHQDLLTTSMIGAIKGGLGIIHFYSDDATKAKALLEESLRLLNKNPTENSMRMAWFLGYLGNVYRDLGDYHQGKFLLENSLCIYKKNYPKDTLRHACFLGYLAIVEGYFGQYDKAKDLFKKGLKLHATHFRDNETYSAWVNGQLGILEREAGNNERAKTMLEESLTSYKIHRAPDHFAIAWALEHLGVVYMNLGEYEKSKKTLENCLEMYASYSPEQLGSAWVLSHLGMHPAGETKNLFDKVCARYKTHLHENYIYIAWPLRQLGNLYGLLGNYPKAKFILEQVLVIYQKNYGKNHLTAAFALSDLGHIYLLEGQLEISENLIRKALMILENNKHPDAYKCLEDLSELYIKKYRLAKAKGDPASANTVYSKAIASLIQAVDIVKIHLPNSAHEKRIREKFEKIQEN